MWDSLWLDAHLATMTPGAAPYGAIRDGAIAAKDGRIAWVGARADLPGKPAELARDVRDQMGDWITPGLVDCHTHLVFAGNRAREFEMRLNGASYEEIARSGGGIASTVAATRANPLYLPGLARRRLETLLSNGVTTVEIKSGYGLDLDSERRTLQAARSLGHWQERESADDHWRTVRSARVRTSFLGLHALPAEYKDDRAGYVDLVCDVILPTLAAEGLVDAVDAFCENIGFTIEETERLFQVAKRLGLPVKLHAEQLSDMGGTQLAARHGALSADHLEYLSDEGVEAMAAAGMVAVLLPGAFYFLRETELPPIDKLRAAGVPMAVATDCNPGTSPLVSPLLAMNMACTLFRLTPEEALAGMTRNGARALGLAGEIGTLEVGKAADFAIWDIGEPAELCYWMGADLLGERVFGGEPYEP